MSQTQYYTIVAGDSLWKISQKFGTTVDALVQMNGFSSSNVTIYPGQRIIVKLGSNNLMPAPTPQPDNNSINPSLNKLVQWFYDNQFVLKYSQTYRHQNEYADCSSAVYRALIYAGFLPAGTPWGSTADLFKLENSLLIPIGRHEARFGDIFVTGPKPIGSHTGVFVSNNECVHMINTEHHIKKTELNGWIGPGVVYCYRIKGADNIVAPTPTPTPTPIPISSEKTEKTYSESGKFTANRSLAIRNEPKETASVAATLLNGESVTYDSVVVTNKFIYISYVSYSGVRRYVAIRTNINGQRGPLWGTII